MKNIGILLGLSLIIGAIAGWVKHIVYCFQQHEYVLLLVGALFAPIGSVHGWGLWYGWW